MTQIANGLERVSNKFPYFPLLISPQYYRFNDPVFRIQMDPGFFADPDPDFKTRIRIRRFLLL